LSGLILRSEFSSQHEVPVKIFLLKFRAGTKISEATEEAGGAVHSVRLSSFQQRISIWPNTKLLLRESSVNRAYQTEVLQRSDLKWVKELGRDLQWSQSQLCEHLNSVFGARR